MQEANENSRNCDRDLRDAVRKLVSSRRDISVVASKSLGDFVRCATGYIRVNSIKRVVLAKGVRMAARGFSEAIILTPKKTSVAVLDMEDGQIFVL